MNLRRDRRWAGVLLASCALVAHGAERAAVKTSGKSPAPDLDFLEYLGTLESDEGNWTDVMNVELPNQTKRSQAKAKSDASGGKPKAEAAAKSAGSEK